MEAAEILGATPEGVAEGELIEQSKWGAIRTLWEGGKSKKAIARELWLDIKTVRKWVKTVWRPQQRRRGGVGLSYVGPWLKLVRGSVGLVILSDAAMSLTQNGRLHWAERLGVRYPDDTLCRLCWFYERRHL